MGKVKRGKKYRDGYWERYTWICVECGREWESMGWAKGCNHTNDLMSELESARLDFH